MHRPEEKRDASTTRSFGFPGMHARPFWDHVDDSRILAAAGTIGKASGDADSSTRNLFDRGGGSGMGLGSTTAEPFGFPRPSAAAPGLGSTDLSSSSMYNHSTLTLPSFLNTPSAAQEGAFNGARMWTEEEAKPRRVLHSPPGLSKPSTAGHAERRSGLRADDRLLPNHRATRSEGVVLQPHLTPMPESPFASTFAAKTQSSLSGVSTSFGSLSSEFSSNLQLSSLQITSNVFSSPPLELAPGKQPMVSNPALAELNSESVPMETLQKPILVQTKHVADGYRTEGISTCELRVSSKQKPTKGPKPTGLQRNGADEKVKAPNLAPTENATAPRSPAAPYRTGRRSSVLSPSQHQQASLGSQANASEITSDRSTKGRPKKRGQPVPETHTAPRHSPAAHHVVADLPVGAKKKASEFSWADQRENASEPSSSPNKHSDDSGFAKTRDIHTDSIKAVARAVTSRKNASRGTEEKTPSSARRQQYREKQPREPPQNPEGESQPSKVVTISAAAPAKQDNSKSQVEASEAKPSQHSDEDTKQTVSSKYPGEKRSQEGEWVTHKKPSRASKATNKTETKVKQDPKYASSPKHADISGSEIGAEKAAVSSKDLSAITAVPEKERKPKAKGGNKNGNDEPGSVAAEADKNHPTSKSDVSGSKCVPPVSTVESQQVRSKAKLEQEVHQEPVQLVQTEPSPSAPIEHEKKVPGKKDKTKKDKSDKKRGGKVKKEKRDSSSSSKGDLLETVLAKTDLIDASTAEAVKSTSAGEVIQNWACFSSEVLRSSVSSMTATFLRGWTWIGAHSNVKGWLQTATSNFESVMAVVFSVLLLCSLHGASWFIRIHRVAFRAILTHRHIGFCFAFLYSFPFLVQYVFPWAPPWAPVCLWYAFLVQLFCTSGPTAMVTTFRVILPLVFLLEGISHHSFLLDLNGTVLIVVSLLALTTDASPISLPP